MVSKLNKKYGLITVLHEVVTPDGNMVLTVCDCGNFNLFKSKNLKPKSCGCLVKKSIDNLVSNVKKPLGESTFNETYNNYKRSAATRGFVFELNKEQFKDITSKHCHYCNSEPSNKLERLASNGAFVYNGIDRLDSNVGYIPNNIVPCCSTCNQMKMEMSRQEFLDHIRLMVSRYDKWKRTA